ncbi:5-deoxy-glucuronate isomerase [Halalkalibacterium halodurans]|jgi:5-deoxy-glucuronate isomerase|uniref:5-deoxy-glucuronate isomerase n=2 Tax=Halalkalibacterium halodurans TaxID=86665 RepID=IOLB_HALH5|nr:5-deoxy-glucuronate isomerase [Halalkalibacterium halodurans]Q9KAG7.1 RecName: Full=5-deoxy-glucuronate isomerase; Short=5DG isomerase [Halalkalibacterium halodurans C-125]MDY7222872.1 5-deoxy-glucuronate isomerase [Halalkalibacterium halodurans]MDY7242093.1 5-deoxy-glucuronate isomerase [Halalkalibacterium halodurans]MED3648116.1 5-deoxy-glucuronate isomerase [Halalkalibacterium halodurans]MED4080897.1 5-deoxy-glucuronate isomerase [Halalkalibacterium halodurans]MED4085080.1 5-deoxy-glucu
MSQLLRKPERAEISKGVTLVHDVTADNASLEYVSFKALDLSQGATYSETLENKECCIVVVTGKVHVTDHEVTFENIGTRESVFEKKPTDSVYVSNNQTFSIEAVTGARVALCYAPSKNQLPTKLIKAEDNGVEHRGKGNNQRMVHNILPDSDPSANSLLVVEVFTESGNWSSYPPHKHDRDLLPEESLLEETYYHEVNPKQGFVFQRVYTDDRSLDETMTVENENMVIVPKGYHPVGVPEGYASYYLNVMAGPKRIWKFFNDPAHEWIIE